jgi:2-keto-3-deoxy-L-rhamnonate aldolase RhmA
VKRTVAASRKHKKGLGFMAADTTWARQYKELGFNMLATGTDHGILMDGVRNIIASVEDK